MHHVLTELAVKSHRWMRFHVRNRTAGSAVWKVLRFQHAAVAAVYRILDLTATIAHRQLADLSCPRRAAIAAAAAGAT